MKFRDNPILPVTWVACALAILACVAVGNAGDRPDGGFTSRMVKVLNGLSEPARARVIEEMRQAAGKQLVFNRPSPNRWNASVTQSSRNWRGGRRPVRETRIIEARYVGRQLVFDYRNPASRVRGTTARPPTTPAAPSPRTGADL